MPSWERLAEQPRTPGGHQQGDTRCLATAGIGKRNQLVEALNQWPCGNGW